MPLIDQVPSQDIRDGFIALNHLRHHPHPHEENPDVQHVLTVHSEGALPSGSGAQPHEAVQTETQQLPLSQDTGLFGKIKAQSNTNNTFYDNQDDPTVAESRRNDPSNRNPTRLDDNDQTFARSVSQTHGIVKSVSHLNTKEDDVLALEEEEKMEEALKEEIREKAFTEQWPVWPPPDQIAHNHVGIIDRFAKKMANKQRVRIRNLFSSTLWLERHWYKVGANLKNDWKTQAIFFAKVMAIKVIQLLIINAWILVVCLTPGIQHEIVDHHDWMYMTLAIFLLIILAVRIISKAKAGWWPAFIVVFLFLITFLMAYALASVTFTYKVFCIPMITGTLLLTFLSIPFVPFMTQTPITKPTVIRAGAVLIVLYSVLILMIVAYTNMFADIAYFACVVWFPGLLSAEVILWVTVYEVQRILDGYSFNVSERRWAFTALYI